MDSCVAMKRILKLIEPIYDTDWENQQFGSNGNERSHA